MKTSDPRFVKSITQQKPTWYCVNMGVYTCDTRDDILVLELDACKMHAGNAYCCYRSKNFREAFNETDYS